MTMISLNKKGECLLDNFICPCVFEEPTTHGSIVVIICWIIVTLDCTSSGRNRQG